jgi:LPS-assembly protein
LWFSFDSDAGLLFRSEPIFQTNAETGVQTLVTRYETGPFSPRLYLYPHITGALQLGPIHIVPSVGIQESYYGEAQAMDPAFPGLYKFVGTNLVRSARDFSVDFILPSLERVFDKKTIFGDKLKHVIEPRATYRYVTGIGTDFNRFIRFDDKDILSDTNELEISLTNRLYAKRGDSVDEVLTWELLQKRYFDPTFGGALVPGVRNLFEATADITPYAFLVTPRTTSPVASLLRVGPVSGLGIQWQADYDPRVRSIVDSAVTIDYRWKKYVLYGSNYEVHLYNEGYQNTQLMPPANQFRFGAGLGDANRRGWNGRAEFLYDYRQGFTQYSQFQATYNTDCCGFSVQFRRFGIQNYTQWRFAFAVANLGSFGTLRKQERMF